MALNEIYIPELNPVLFFEINKVNLPKYFTKHFEDYPFEERLYFWQEQVDFKQVWQVEDIIFLQFESSFDPVTIKLIDMFGQTLLTLPALLMIASINYPGLFAYEIECSLAGLPTGCYRMMLECGSSGPMQRIFMSPIMFVSATPLPNTLLTEYWSSRKFHRDVMFVTGIKFQVRFQGAIGFLEKARKDESYRDENYNPTLLNSRSAKQWPIFYGNFCGLPDDAVNLLDHIWSCNNVRVDNKSYGIADGSKMEFFQVENYPKRGVKLTVEAGINRNSRIFAIDTDTTKKLLTTIEVEAQVFGDTGNQGSSNTIPVTNSIPE